MQSTRLKFIFTALFSLLLFQARAQLFRFNEPACFDTLPCGKAVFLAGDENCSSFFICIPEKVKKHKHVHHTEHVYILEGEAEMILGEKKIKIKKGDFFLIPKGTPHAVTVTSSLPLKIISIQSPAFDGTDRVWVED